MGAALLMTEAVSTRHWNPRVTLRSRSLRSLRISSGIPDGAWKLRCLSQPRSPRSLSPPGVTSATVGRFWGGSARGDAKSRDSPRSVCRANDHSQDRLRRDGKNCKAQLELQNLHSSVRFRPAPQRRNHLRAPETEPARSRAAPRNLSSPLTSECPENGSYGSPS